MNHKNFIAPSQREVRIGAVYMVAQMSVLPRLVLDICAALNLNFSAAEMNVIFFLINFGAVTLIFRKFLKRTFFGTENILFQIFFAVLQGFGIKWLGDLLVDMLIYRINPDFVNVNDASILAMLEENFLPLAICTAFFVPIAEELLYRGVLFGGFFKRSPALAFFFSTTIFCAIHVLGYIEKYPLDTLLLCYIQYIPTSIAFGFAYGTSGSIFAPMLMHIIINASGILVLR